MSMSFLSSVSRSDILLQIAQRLLNNKKTAEQVRNLWNRNWDLYKAVRHRQEHTGGGDGDDESDDKEDEGHVDEVEKQKKPGKTA